MPLPLLAAAPAKPTIGLAYAVYFVYNFVIIENPTIHAMAKTLFITGGAGFIGSALIRYLLTHTDTHVVNIDKLTYAGNLHSLPGATQSPRYCFSQTDIRQRALLNTLFEQHQPDGIMHLAAESHVDRAIDAPSDFIDTNIVGTYTLLEATRQYWQQLPASQQQAFRFHHISTDEVYGDRLPFQHPCDESTAYAPSSPYSASKAAADHLVQAWQRTYGLPVLMTHCSNNYGPYQHPEKLIPHFIIRAIHGQALPIYGDGKQIRDWLYIDDHITALWAVYNHAPIGSRYNIGAQNQPSNLDIAHELCDLLDSHQPPRNQTATAHLTSYRQLITHVDDRPGHDRRYAMDTRKITQELGWQPQETIQSGLTKTVQWYLSHPAWWQNSRAIHPHPQCRASS